MDPITRQGISVAGGASGASGPPYVDEVFSTFLYNGTSSSAQTIANDINLSGEGGLVWIKNRDSNDENTWIDTERGNTKYLTSHQALGQQSNSAQITSFNSNGFSLGAANQVNRSGNAFVSWTFRKAPGFFDVVTYTGNGTAGRTVSHNLGSVPGFIIVKRYSATEDWTCYHRSIGATKYLQLNSTYAEIDDDRAWNDTEPTSSVFTVGAHDRVNTNGQNYVAYVFAHDDQSFGTDEDEAIIKCGSYTGNGSSTGPSINLGFEPQWLLIKSATGSNASGIGWYLLDNMRGIGAPGVNDKTLSPNTTGAESTGSRVGVTSTGFTLTTSSGIVNGNSTGYIYMAIRRPHKPPTAGTEVFAIDTLGGTSPTPPGFNATFPVDAAWFADVSSGGTIACTRLQGLNDLYPYLTNGVGSSGNRKFDYQNGFLDVNAVNSNYYCWMFRRAPGFFDLVTYAGNGSATRQITHNLEATPELIIVKSRSNTSQWLVWSTSFGQGTTQNYMTLNSNNPRSNTNPPIFTTSAPTSTYFNVAYDSGFNAQYVPNVSSYTYVAYLFATLDGISKVGTYSGTGYSVNVDCGFTAGARFVLIKRTDSSGDWYLFDTSRGIVSGNDPYLLLNSSAAQVANTDYIDPLNAGFTVSSSAPAALNTSGGTYLFLAIA